MVFGVFDGLHEGHRSFLSQARGLGDYVIAVVARDEVVEKLKGRSPLRPLESRIEELRKSGVIGEAVAGDTEPGRYSMVEAHRPAVIAFGYDQDALRADFMSRLDRFDFQIDVLVWKSFEPEKYHSSRMR